MMRDRIRFCVIVALVTCCQDCLAVSTSTEELDDTSLFWMNESRNLKEPHWSSDSDNMFLTGSNLSSLGKLSLSKTTIKDDSTASTILDTTKITPTTKDTTRDTISSPMPNVENHVEDKSMNTNNKEVKEVLHVVVSESVKGTSNENDGVTKEFPREGNDLAEMVNVTVEVIQKKDQEAGNKNNSDIQITTFTDEKVVPSLLDDNDSQDSNNHLSNTAKRNVFLNKDESSDYVTAEIVSSNETVLESLDSNSNVTEESQTPDENMHELGDPPDHVVLETSTSTVTEEDRNNNHFTQANNSTIDKSSIVNDEQDDDGHSKPEIESLSEPTARLIDDSGEYDAELIDFDELEKKNHVHLENIALHDGISTLEIPSEGLIISTGLLESQATIHVSSGPVVEAMDGVPRADKRPPKEGSLAEFFKKVSPENNFKSPMTKQQSGSKIQSEGLKEMIDTTEVTGKETHLATASEMLSDTLTNPNHIVDAGMITSDSEKENLDEILFGYTSIWGKKKHVLDKKFPEFNFRSNSVPKVQSASEAEEESLRIGATNSENYHTPTLIDDDKALKSGDNRGDADQINSVNDEFVKGLDDIDKLFENVQPPDELDVGAAGSSIQEVLMGQGARILRKRVGMAVEHVKTFFSRHRGTEHFALIPRDVIEDSLIRLTQIRHRFVRKVHDFIVDIFYGADDNVLDFDLIAAEEASKLENLRKAKVKVQSDERSSVDIAVDDKHIAADDKLEAFMQQRLAMLSQ